MKNNIILSLILVIILAIAYYSEEVYKLSDDYKAIAFKKSIIKGEILSLNLKNVELKNTAGQWGVEKLSWNLNQDRIVEMISYFRNIMIKGEMDQSDRFTWDQKYPFTFVDKLNKEVNLNFLGVSSITGAMYLEHSEFPGKILIAQDTNSLEEPYQNEADAGIKKFERIKKLLNSKISNYLETSLSKAFKFSNIKSILVDNKRNKKFGVIFTENKTHPLSFHQSGYLDSNTVFEGLSNQIIVQKVYRKGKNILSNKRSDLHIATENRTYHFELFLSRNDQYGKYLKLNGGNEVYKVDLQTPNIFFSHVQLFWDKSFPYGRDFSKINRLDFSLQRKKDKSPFSFYIDDLTTFEAKAKNKNISSIEQTRLNFLFNLLLNLTEFRQPEYIEKIEKGKKPLYELRVKLLDQDFLIDIINNKIFVRELKNKISYVFKLNTDQVRSGFFDKIFTVESK